MGGRWRYHEAKSFSKATCTDQINISIFPSGIIQYMGLPVESHHQCLPTSLAGKLWLGRARLAADGPVKWWSLGSAPASWSLCRHASSKQFTNKLIGVNDWSDRCIGHKTTITNSHQPFPAKGWDESICASTIWHCTDRWLHVKQSIYPFGKNAGILHVESVHISCDIP